MSEPKVKMEGFIGANGNMYKEKKDAEKYGGGVKAIKKVYEPVVEEWEEAIETKKASETAPEDTSNSEIANPVEGVMARNIDLDALEWTELKSMAAEYKMENLNKAKKAQVIEFLKGRLAN